MRLRHTAMNTTYRLLTFIKKPGNLRDLTTMYLFSSCKSEKEKPPYTIAQYDAVLLDLLKRKEAAVHKILSRPKSESTLKEALATSRKYSRLIESIRKEQYNYYFKK
jgi:hypothetical protein